MAGTITNNNSAANSAPTGKVNIVSGVTNAFKMNCQANQQILVGDLLIQNNTSNTFTALPAICVSNPDGATSNAAANNNLRLYICNNFAGFATTYRSPKNTSSGKPSDIVGVATGRMRLPVNTANATCFGNNTGIGTFWGVACTQNNQYNGTSTPLANNSWVLLGSDGLPVYEQVATANLAVGRQSLPKNASDSHVWVDSVSTLVASGPQEPAST